MDIKTAKSQCAICRSPLCLLCIYILHTYMKLCYCDSFMYKLLKVHVLLSVIHHPSTGKLWGWSAYRRNFLSQNSRRFHCYGKNYCFIFMFIINAKNLYLLLSHWTNNIKWVLCLKRLKLLRTYNGFGIVFELIAKNIWKKNNLKI